MAKSLFLTLISLFFCLCKLTPVANADEPVTHNNERCYYGGWPSFIAEKGKRKFCWPINQKSVLMGLPGCKKKNEVACNPVFFGQVCVPKSNDTTSACFKKAEPTSHVIEKISVDSRLRQIWDVSVTMVDDICYKYPNEDNCKRLSEIRKSVEGIDSRLGYSFYTKPISATQINDNLAFPSCNRSRDQGWVGSCGAFCALCSWDVLVRRKAVSEQNYDKLGFRSSANWAALMMAMTKLCAGSTKLLNGSLPEDNIEMLSRFGVCDETHYSPYSPVEPDARGALGAPKGPRGGDRILELLAGTKKVSDKDRNKAFYLQFGISEDSAKRLFCGVKTVDDSYEGRLQELATSGHVKKEFIACAREALANARYIAPDLQECLPWPFDGGENRGSRTQILDAQFRVKWVKEYLAKNKIPLPVSFDYKTINSENKPDVGRHCVTVVAYDDDHERFIVVNSWGFKSQYSYESVGYYDYDLAAAHPVGCAKPRQKAPESDLPVGDLVH